MRLRGIPQIAAVAVIAAISGLGGCAHVRATGESFTAKAVAEVIPSPVGCGVIFVGTPVTYRVVSGPSALKGKRIEAVVPCLDFYREFYVVGHTYNLQLVRNNLYEIEVWPDRLDAPFQFFQQSATDLETDKTNTWDATTRRGY